MLRVTEFLDIAKIKEIREQVLNKPLDFHDNFSWHAALFEEQTLLGTGRLYRSGEDIVIDCIALISSERNHLEMLFRTLLLKASNSNSKRIFSPDQDQKYTAKFGFKHREDGYYVLPSEILFPSECCHK